MKSCLLAVIALLLMASPLQADQRHRDPVEPARLSRWQAAAMPVIAPTLAAARAELSALRDPVQLTAAAHAFASELWQQAVTQVQRDIHAPNGHVDDRPLYWSRLALQLQLSERADALQLNDADRHRLWLAAEYSSRGMTAIDYGDASERIFVTGFDPFRLDQDWQQSNPSGLAALALDGKILHVGNRRLRIEAVMVPVRFADFDAGLVEHVLTPILRDPQMKLLTTISMGRDGFDLERFPGRRRSADATDNVNHKTGGTPARPVLPLLGAAPLDGPEFVEFSLPVAAMLRVQSPFPVIDNGKVTTLSGALTATDLADLRYHTAVNGSGGGYLSNEISYRSLLLRDQLNPSLPVGHIHTPRVRGYQPEQERKIVMQIEQLLRAAVAIR